MNAFPPPRLVTRGAYRFVRDPIYFGFALLCFGASLSSGSAAALWIVSPVVVIGMGALTFGYERHDLRRRFGCAADMKPLLSLPAAGSERPSLRDYLSIYLLVFLPWLVLYEAVVFLGPARDAVPGYLPFEYSWPVLEWSELVYISAYPFIALAPLAAHSRRSLRRFGVCGLLATGLGFFLFFLIPLSAPPRPFVPETWLGRLLILERRYDTPATAFPSFHLLWALLAARVYAERGRAVAAAAWIWAAAIGVSCVTTGMHAIIDLVGALILAAVVTRVTSVWEVMRRISEVVANSWWQCRVGPIRVINHGLYAAAGAFTGFLIVTGLTGSEHTDAVLAISCLSMISAALWAQLVEGSPRLLRPYGYYGSLLGGVAATLITAPLYQAPLWLLMGAFGVAAPWVQAFGRLRCLVQGCCHGFPAPERIGIRYRHPRSRVCLHTEYRGVPLHPTQLYSILSNIVLGALLARLWSLGWTPQVIAGLYLIGSSLARFVEESYRGEPQTRMVAGLAVYQWLAVGCLLLGCAMTMIPGATPLPAPRIDGLGVALAGGFGLLVWVAMSVDFPESNRRFARLSG